MFQVKKGIVILIWILLLNWCISQKNNETNSMNDLNSTQTILTQSGEVIEQEQILLNDLEEEAFSKGLWVHSVYRFWWVLWYSNIILKNNLKKKIILLSWDREDLEYTFFIDNELLQSVERRYVTYTLPKWNEESVKGDTEIYLCDFKENDCENDVVFLYDFLLEREKF